MRTVTGSSGTLEKTELPKLREAVMDISIVRPGDPGDEVLSYVFSAPDDKSSRYQFVHPHLDISLAECEPIKVETKPPLS